MKQVLYPDAKRYNFSQAYLDLFSSKIIKMQADYTKLLASDSTLSFLPSKIEDILLANFHNLVSWYVSYINTSKSSHTKLESIFNYDHWSDIISEYFKNPINGFDISTCCYCETAYVNVYEVNPDEDALYFLNNASDDELMKMTKSVSRIKEIKRRRPYKSKADYDSLALWMRWSPNKYDRLFKPNRRYRHQFDLDHVLPKSKCPFVGLSLYNFVPSCQTCNQRLKKTKVLGLNGIPEEKLSPTSDKFDFDNKVSFLISPLAGSKIEFLPTKSSGNFELLLQTADPQYEYFIKLFKLDERYNYHKMIALNWLEKKIKYKDSRINMMAEALKDINFTFERIKSDIFCEDLYQSREMVFSKLRKDILK